MLPGLTSIHFPQYAHFTYINSPESLVSFLSVTIQPLNPADILRRAGGDLKGKKTGRKGGAARVEILGVARVND